MKYWIAIIFCFAVKSFPVSSFDHDYKEYSFILKKYVSNGRVDYESLKKNHKKLRLVLKGFSQVEEITYNRFTKNQKMAFLINAYNLFTIELVLKNYPIASIKDVQADGLFSFLGSPWKIEFFELFGRKRTLDWIEHDILRKKFQEPKLHFALVCASKSCPILIDEPYKPNILQKQLDKSAFRFLNTNSRNYYDAKIKILFLSKIFEWYREDFIHQTSLLEFVKKYIREDIPQDTKIEYLEYDWGLNEK